MFEALCFNGERACNAGNQIVQRTRKRACATWRSRRRPCTATHHALRPIGF